VKSIAKKLVAAILGRQIRQLYKKNHFKVIAVAGSIGKTSTKLAIAQVVSSASRVRYQDGNYNDLVTVPLIFFDQLLPSLLNPFAWLMVFWRNQKQLSKPYPYDAVVVELGSDGPGQIAQFAKYLKIEIGVLTAITPEHMEYFADLDAVAAEETQISKLSTLTLVNADLCPPKYLNGISNKLSYGINAEADIKLAAIKFDNLECSFDVFASDQKLFSAEHEAFSEPQLYSILAAIAVAHKLGLPSGKIKEGVARIKPVAGRMQRLLGVNGSLIIDDTYNASPEAVKAALQTLYRLQAPQKIAVLGNRTELGRYSQAEHEAIGKLCDPKQLDLVVTIGPDANKYLALAAEAKGCKVATFDNPYTAGEYLKPLIQKGAVILAKGSQNGVFAEETAKLILANPNDSTKLVRQSQEWLKIKKKAFKQ
jgi:UDP-N-acetylmuramyl pentapeptide synthase